MKPLFLEVQNGFDFGESLFSLVVKLNEHRVSFTHLTVVVEELRSFVALVGGISTIVEPRCFGLCYSAPVKGAD